MGRIHENSLDEGQSAIESDGTDTKPLEIPVGAFLVPLPLICNTSVVTGSPTRIVSLQPSATITLRDLSKLDALVACTKYCLEICPQAAENHPAVVADSWTAQSAQIAELKPDLVIASVPYQIKALAEIMKSGARFLGLAPKSLSDIHGDITIIAGIMNAREEGERVTRHMKTQLMRVRNVTRSLPTVKVFCEEWGKPLIASQRWVAELIEAAGGIFVGAPGVQLELEEVERSAPDVLIAAWCGAGDRVPLEKIIHQRRWENLAAVRNRHVYCISDEFLNTPASTLIYGLHALAAAIHPDHFPRPEGLKQLGELKAC